MPKVCKHLIIKHPISNPWALISTCLLFAAVRTSTLLRRLSTKCGDLYSFSHTSIRVWALRYGEEAWCALGVQAKPKGVQCSWNQVYVQAAPGLSHHSG